MSAGACPSWCAGGQVPGDTDTDGSTYHPGPQFGYVSLAAITEADGSVRQPDAGVQMLGLDSSVMVSEAGAAELRQLAADALAAAEWIEAQA